MNEIKQHIYDLCQMNGNKRIVASFTSPYTSSYYIYSAEQSDSDFRFKGIDIWGKEKLINDHITLSDRECKDVSFSDRNIGMTVEDYILVKEIINIQNELSTIIRHVSNKEEILNDIHIYI